MSQFPRFTTGSLGRLSFEHVNEMLDLLERLRPLLKQSPDAFLEPKRDFLWARITGSTVGGAHEWTEVIPQNRDEIRTAIRWEERIGGRKSGESNSAEFQPAFAVPNFDWDGSDPYNYAQDTVVLLYRIQGKDGKPGWMVVGVIATETTFPAMIMGSTPAIGQPTNPIEVRRWHYSWQEATVQTVTVPGLPHYAKFVLVPDGKKGGSVIGATYQYAINGCERDGLTGIGGTIPQGTYERPAPIANGVVVTMDLKGNYGWFSTPNGLFVSCNPF